VTDFNGCSITASVTITQPTVLTATMGLPTNVLCNGGNNGTATVTAGGGTVNYAYSWAPNGGTNANGTGLTAGSYTVTVTDHDGCIATASVTITQPTILTAAMGVPTNILCNGGNNGSATVTAGGGTVPYTYLWAPTGGTNASATGLTANSYTVTVKDNNGCATTASVTITQPTVVTAVITGITPVSCNGDNNGNATVTAAGGTTPYKYSWSPNGGTNATGTGLTAGVYTVTVTDANGCNPTAVVTITEPGKLVVNASGPPTDCSGAPITLTSLASGGTGPYLYSWAPAGGTNATTIVSPLVTTVYTLTVTDSHGCITTVVVPVVAR
jgi:hypothetical protein